MGSLPIDAMDGVEKTVEISKSYKLASREFHPQSTIVDVDGVKIGGGNLVVMTMCFSIPCCIATFTSRSSAVVDHTLIVDECVLNFVLEKRAMCPYVFCVVDQR